MSESAKKLFESLREIAPGLKDLVPEVTAELSRMGTQGGAELASALFNGHAFVQYGAGQYTPDIEQQAEQEQTNEQARSERGMER